jgi:hypothetical protein
MQNGQLLGDHHACTPSITIHSSRS